MISVGEYLSTCYRPDVDFVDGRLLERNVGEWDHGLLVAELIGFFGTFERDLGLLAVPSLRMRLGPSHFRVVDVCLLRGNPGEQILTRPPFACIEVLSPEDRMSLMMEKIDVYLAFGVENVWVIDPGRKKAFWADVAGLHAAVGGVLTPAGAEFQMDLSGMWPSRGEDSCWRLEVR